MQESRHGAGIVSRHRMVAEQELTLRMMETNRETEVRVVGEIGKEGEMYTYGVAFLDEEQDFWRMEFPPAPVWRPEALTLECGVCKSAVELANGDFEYDICAIHGGLARFCNECGMLTVWRRSQEVGPREKQAGSAGPGRVETAVAVQGKKKEFVPLAKATAGTERRTRTRVKVNFSGCVKTERFGEEIVKCDDMSRGGVSFWSRNEYEKEMVVRMAVPYTPGAKEETTIFVRGRIANVMRVQGGRWRCGVEFLKE